jgi:endogenous inhibitor of DNA gyrase (YacG/DUF329 family)
MTTPPRKPRKCPVCGKPLTEPGLRFCSERCQRVDLGRWLTGTYAIPAVEEEPEDEAGMGGQP